MAIMPHGSADWAGPEVHRERGIWATNGGVPIGYYTDRLEGGEPPLRQQIRYTGDRHVCLVAPNGSGKSMRCALPFAWESVGWSLAVCDLKGEFRDLTARHRASHGSEVLVLDPFGKQSHGFNPIQTLDPSKDEFVDDALELSEAIIRIEGKEPHWAQAAQELVSALIMYVRLVMPNGSFSDVRKLLGRNDQDWRNLVNGGRDTDPAKLALWERQTKEQRDPKYFPPIRHLGGLYPGMAEAADMYDWPEIETKVARFGGITPEDREMHGVISTALVQTRWLDSRPIQRDLAKPPFDFAQLKERPITVYVVIPPRRLRTHSSWVRLIFASIIQKLMIEAKHGKVPVCLLCDEFAALAGSSMGAGAESSGDGFPAISANMAVFRQYGVKLYSIWQDLAQARRIYGDGFETFLANAGVFRIP